MNLQSLLPNNTSPVLIHNLGMLLERKRGQRFRVDKEGKLVEISGIGNRILYYLRINNERGRVKKTISTVVKNIVSDKDQTETIKKLFFEKLRPLSKRVFERGEISTEVEGILSPGLAAFRKGRTGRSSAEKLEKRVEEVRLAVKLGVDFKPVTEGQNGTYFGSNRKGKRLVVFKPSDEECFISKNRKFIAKIKMVLFKLFPCLISHRNIRRECLYLNEVGASKVDNYLGLKVVPETKLESFESKVFKYGEVKKGSCQLYVNEAKMAIEALPIPSFGLIPIKQLLRKLCLKVFSPFMPRILLREELEKLAILDFLTGNQDCHLSNFLVKKKNAVAIDQGLSFPKSAPSHFLSTTNQYFWKHLKEAKEPFSEGAKKWLEKLKDPEKLFEILKKEMRDGDLEGFNDEQKEEMKRRIKVLIKVVEEQKTIAYLGSIQTEKDFERVLNPAS